MLLVLATGCGEQAEGDRCDTRNGNTDCESGLTCTPLERLGQGREGAICCPPPPANPSELICTPATFDLGVGDDDDDDDDDDQGEEDAATPASPLDAASGPQDASQPLTDAATLDASGDAAKSATSDAALDAAADPDATD